MSAGGTGGEGALQDRGYLGGGYCLVGAEGTVRISSEPGPLHRVVYILRLGMRIRDIGKTGRSRRIAGVVASQKSGYIGPGGASGECAPDNGCYLMGGNRTVRLKRAVGVTGEPTLLASENDISMRDTGIGHIREPALPFLRRGVLTGNRRNRIGVSR